MELIDNASVPRDITMEQFGHNHKTALAFCANYTAEEIGGQYDLTVTVMGYELGEMAALVLMNSLSVYLVNLHDHKQLQRQKT